MRWYLDCVSRFYAIRFLLRVKTFFIKKYNHASVRHTLGFRRDSYKQTLGDTPRTAPNLRHGELARAHGVALEGVLRERPRRRDDQEDLPTQAADAE